MQVDREDVGQEVNEVAVAAVAETPSGRELVDTRERCKMKILANSSNSVSGQAVVAGRRWKW